MRVLWSYRRRCDGHVQRSTRRRCRRADARAQEGFTLVETMVALGLIFTVLLGLLASLNTGISGLLTGRHRTGAVAIAKQYVEEARGANYGDLGHDLAGDPTLADDSALTGAAPDYYYQPEGVATPEPLVGAANAVYPQHEKTETRDGTTYTVLVYVTSVDQITGDDHKRLTVAVTWASDDADSVSNEVRVSTFISSFGVVSSSEIGGVIDVDAGSVNITGTLADTDLSSAEMFFPYAHADAAADLITESRGFARSTRSDLKLNTGSPTGCTVSGSTASCTGVEALTATDNDGGTALPLQQADGPYTYSGGTSSAGSAVDLVIGTGGAAESKSSSQSCTTCSPVVGDGDGFLYGLHDADGATSMGAEFVAGTLSGSLFDMDGAGSATATLDSDAVVSDQKITSTGEIVMPAADLILLDTGPPGYTSAVHVSAFSLTAQAQAGPTALTPSVSGDAITVTLYDTNGLGLPEYRSFSFSPGDTVEESATVSFTVGGASVIILETTVTTGSVSTSSQSSGGAITVASANLTNWFVVQTHFEIVEAGVTVADVTVDLDYGRLAASGEYEPA